LQIHIPRAYFKLFSNSSDETSSEIALQECPNFLFNAMQVKLKWNPKQISNQIEWVYFIWTRFEEADQLWYGEYINN